MLAQAAADNNAHFWVWGFILLGVAIGLLAIEFIVPSGGLLGLLCGVAAIGSIVAFFQVGTSVGIASVLGYAVATPVLLVFFFKVWIHSPLAKRMVLGDSDDLVKSTDEEDLRASEHDRMQRLEKLRELIGADGVTETSLRPVGVVKLNGQRLDAMAESGVIEANTPVEVVDVYDNQIKVRPKTAF